MHAIISETKESELKPYLIMSKSVNELWFSLEQKTNRNSPVKKQAIRYRSK